MFDEMIPRPCSKSLRFRVSDTPGCNATPPDPEAMLDEMIVREAAHALGVCAIVSQYAAR